MARYKYNSRGANITAREVNGVTDTLNGSRSIPNAPGNRDWYEYTQWKLALDVEGNPLPAPENVAPNTADNFQTLQEIKDAKKNELKTACKTEIFNGFDSTVQISSDANKTFHYESNEQDQRNLLGASTTTSNINFTVVDAGVKKRVSHTPVEIAAVYAEGVIRIGDIKDDLYLYYTDVDNAVDETAVDAISWVYPKV